MDEIAEAWMRLFGTKFEPGRRDCVYFASGWNVAKGRI